MQKIVEREPLSIVSGALGDRLGSSAPVQGLTRHSLALIPNCLCHSTLTSRDYETCAIAQKLGDERIPEFKIQNGNDKLSSGILKLLIGK